MSVDREYLNTLMLQNDSLDWWQPERFRTYVMPHLPPEIEVLTDPPAEHENYNCFLYAFGLHTDNTIRRETNGFIYDSLVKHWLKTGVLERTNTPEGGDFILYQGLIDYPETITHIGVLEPDGRVVSKWAWGPLVRHHVFDVPQEYGDTVFYVKAITPHVAGDLYRQHKSHNLPPTNA